MEMDSRLSSVYSVIKRIVFLPIYPLLIAIHPILNLYVTNHHIIRFNYFLISCLTILFLAVLVLVLIRQLDVSKTSYVPITASILGVTFHYGAIYDAIGTIPFGHVYQRHSLLLPLGIFLIVLLMTLIVRFRAYTHRITPLLNLISFTVVVSVVIQIFETVPNIIKYPNLYQALEEISKSSHQLNNRVQLGYIPDVYYIILDGYGRADVLGELYDYDNDEFLSTLSEIGFYVASESRSNYSQTAMSLASSLNGMYLEELGVLNEDYSTRDRSVIQQRLVRENLVTREFKDFGYTTVMVDSGFSFFTSNIPNADITYRFEGIDEFIWNVLDTTLYRAIFPTSIQKSRFNGISQMFESLSIIPTISEPTFTFAHIPIPHPPYIFDEEGGFTKAAGFLNIDGNGWLPRSSYIDQVEIINKLLEDLLKEIIEGSDNQPIIVIQADHGPMSTWMEPKETLPILNALYLPRNGAEFLYPSISPVNTFRLIFDLYFDRNYGLVDDRSYWANYQFKHDLMCETLSLPDGSWDIDTINSSLISKTLENGYRLDVKDCEFEIIQQLDDGLYDLERSGDTYFRWSAERVNFSLPVVSIEDQHLVLGVTGLFENKNQITVSIDGTHVGTSEVFEGFQEIEFYILEQLLIDRNFIDVSISHSYVNRSISPRPLSIMYHSIGMIPVMYKLEDNGIVERGNLILNELSEDIYIDRFETLAHWTIEEYSDETLLWLGEGEEEGLEIRFFANNDMDIYLLLSVEPGPSRSDLSRTVMIRNMSGGNDNKYRQEFSEASEQKFLIHVNKGANTVHIFSIDEATIEKQPNGDERPLMILLRSVIFTGVEPD